VSHPEGISPLLPVLPHFAFCQDLSTLFPSFSYSTSFLPLPWAVHFVARLLQALNVPFQPPPHSPGKQCSGYMAHGMTGRHRRISARKRKSLLSHKGERVAIIIILIARHQPRQLVMVVDGGGGGGAVVQWYPA